MKDLFIVKLGVKLGIEALKKSAPSWVSRFVLSGPLGFVIMFFGEKFLGLLVERAIIQIDIGINGIKEAMSLEEYRAFAKEAYERTTAKVYTEEEKQVIRKQYLDALSRFGAFGV